jgi:hypothetical protein
MPKNSQLEELLSKHKEQSITEQYLGLPSKILSYSQSVLRALK